MKKIKFSELENMVCYNNITSFVYNNGTQTIAGEGEINEDSLSPFYQAESIELYDMNELPNIKEAMKDNILEVFEPAYNVEDDGYNSMVADFADGNGEIAKCENDGTTTYMLVW